MAFFLQLKLTLIFVDGGRLEEFGSFRCVVLCVCLACCVLARAWGPTRPFYYLPNSNDKRVFNSLVQVLGERLYTRVSLSSNPLEEAPRHHLYPAPPGPPRMARMEISVVYARKHTQSNRSIYRRKRLWEAFRSFPAVRFFKSKAEV